MFPLRPSERVGSRKATIAEDDKSPVLWFDTFLRIEEARGKGYCLEDFTEVFRRYMPKADIAELLREASNGAGPENDERRMLKSRRN
jgi:hypothetical protein